MKLRKLLSLTLAGLISSALLVGCSTASGEDKTIKAVSYTHLTLPTTDVV